MEAAVVVGELSTASKNPVEPDDLEDEDLAEELRPPTTGSNLFFQMFRETSTSKFESSWSRKEKNSSGSSLGDDQDELKDAMISNFRQVDFISSFLVKSQRRSFEFSAERRAGVGDRA